jgi:hypothetical protein
LLIREVNVMQKKSKATSTNKPKKKKTVIQNKEAKRPGRPVEITDEQIEMMLRKCNGRVYLAAEKLDCCAQTILNRLDKNPVLKAIKQECRGRLIDHAEDGLLDAVKDKEPWAIKYALSTLGRGRGFVERKEIRHGGDTNAPPIQSQVAPPPLSPDDLPIDLKKRLLDILRAKKQAMQASLDNTPPQLGFKELSHEQKEVK